ncbi:monocyte to macrophage differentiation factor-like isoform X2 [Ctenocephalides felis]|uniref:monocyte to macrophage differentiation factor-like isoform X2 n=1 Tax=Ctenocephalides felis TaxID=7515 RepID=UPI000E6E3937|nr:monocyte to macrophage differentiation factor-like isoform X2 [Ctenocephalides felis]
MKENIKRGPIHFRMSIPWQQLRDVNWMNKKACANQAYIPTQVEHIANVITHGVWVVPSILAGLELLRRSTNTTQYLSAIIYGAALTMLLTVSTFFHSVFYCNKNKQLKDALHRCDRAMIYVFIAGSYFPWLTITPEPQMTTVIVAMRWVVWLLAALGILYQQIFHERYKTFETLLYLIMGVGPSIVILLSDHELSGLAELKLGGVLYILGVFFFKADGSIPCAHAIWHLFVVLAAAVHYYAILNYLYPELTSSRG